MPRGTEGTLDYPFGLGEDSSYHLQISVVLVDHRMEAMLLLIAVTLGKLLNISVPWLPHVYNADDNSIYFIGLLKNKRANTQNDYGKHSMHWLAREGVIVYE